MTQSMEELRGHFSQLALRLPTGGVAEVFPDEATCLTYMRDHVWPDGPCCPHCHTLKVSIQPKDSKYWCKTCRKQFTLKSVTIFRSSRLSLRWWFLAAERFLQAYARKREAVLLTEERFAQDLGVSRMTARRVLAVLRADMGCASGGLIGALLCGTRRPF